MIESQLINIEHIQRAISNFGRYQAIEFNIGKIPYASQQSVGDPRRAPRPPGNFSGALLLDVHIQQMRGPLHNLA